MKINDTVVCTVGEDFNDFLVKGREYTVVGLHPGNIHTPENMIEVSFGGESGIFYQYRFNLLNPS